MFVGFRAHALVSTSGDMVLWAFAFTISSVAGAEIASAALAGWLLAKMMTLSGNDSPLDYLQYEMLRIRRWIV